MVKSRPAAERFVEKINVVGECWIWTASGTGTGYGGFWDGERMVGAHRWVYQQVKGPVPGGLELDHLCRKTRCVRPAHLEAVTHAENMHRGTGFPTKHVKPTHCQYGHIYDFANTAYTTSTGVSGQRIRKGRRCRECDRLSHRRLYQPAEEASRT